MPALGFGGFTVQAGSDLYNVYNTGGSYYQLAGADCSAAYCGQPGHLGTNIVFTATLVPSIDWTFSYAGAGVNASGVLTTLATPVGGGYQIVGLSGARNGQGMNALFPAGTYSASGGGLLISDNLLFGRAHRADVALPEIARDVRLSVVGASRSTRPHCRSARRSRSWANRVATRRDYRLVEVESIWPGGLSIGPW